MTKNFLKKVFNEIWLKVGEHEHINITEIDLKKYSTLKWRPKQFLSDSQSRPMLIYANENGAAYFFSPKDAYQIFRQFHKKKVIFLRVLTEDTKNNVFHQNLKKKMK